MRKFVHHGQKNLLFAWKMEINTAFRDIGGFDNFIDIPDGPFAHSARLRLVPAHRIVVSHQESPVQAAAAQLVELLADGGELLAEGEPDAIRKDERVVEAYLGAH